MLIPPRRIRVVFVLTALTLGGAEMMLWKLLSRIDRRRFDPQIVALSARTDGMHDRFREIDVPCEVLGMRPRLDASWRVLHLARALRTVRPDIVQGWLYHGNVAATLAAAVTRVKAPVLWNIRGTLPSPTEKNWRSSLVIRLSGLLSSSPACIINNSYASAAEHEARLGYPKRSEIVLANGFDTNLFCPSPEACGATRRELAIETDAFVVGLVGRYHPMKDHANFLRAAAELKSTHQNVCFVLAGTGVDCENAALNALITSFGLGQSVKLLGRRHDMHRITAAFDVACSASAYGEGFPNVIGEAMSCAVPCAVTDVGDSAWIVADTGKVVPPREPHALARAVADLAAIDSAGRYALGLRARERIVEHYSLDAIVRQYEELYSRVHAERARPIVLAHSIRVDER